LESINPTVSCLEDACQRISISPPPAIHCFKKIICAAPPQKPCTPSIYKSTKRS
jgi:hypothetical protein